MSPEKNDNHFVPQDIEVASRPENEITDPVTFISLWRQSDEYTKGYNRFYEGKTLADDLTEKDKREVFEAYHLGGQSLIEFGKRTSQEGRPFVYVAENYSNETRGRVEIYVSAAEFLIDQQRCGDRESIIKADEYRAYSHNLVARSLVKDGIVATEKTGRALARLILIDKKLDSFSQVGLTDEERARIRADRNTGN